MILALVGAYTTIGRAQGHDYVDLGLPSGTLWATMNVGANSPEDYGDYFAWGETAPKSEYDRSSYKWYRSNGDYDYMTKYCTDSVFGYSGFVDNKTELEPGDDAATANWGSGWRIPSTEQMAELYDNCTSEWTTINGVNGTLFKSKKNGASLFLPAAGYRWNSELGYAGTDGYYWSRTLGTGCPGNTYGLYFDSSGVCVYGYWDDYWINGWYRFTGRSVRAVRVS